MGWWIGWWVNRVGGGAFKRVIWGNGDSSGRGGEGAGVIERVAGVVEKVAGSRESSGAVERVVGR